ncbi:MAG: hypothetical protein WB662_04000 [Methyloceanibacter sp.]
MKQIYDRRIPIRFIFCGIGQSLDAITGGHLSASRPILPVALEPMSHDARWAIINTAAEKLGFMVDREFVIRIGQISDGFPYYVHLIGSVLSWAIFDHRQMTLNVWLIHEERGGDLDVAKQLCGVLGPDTKIKIDSRISTKKLGWVTHFKVKIVSCSEK